MTSRIIPVQPFDCIIFGATGDLSHRKLLPALYHRLNSGQMEGVAEQGGRIIGTSRSNMNDDDFRTFAVEAIEAAVSEEELNKETLERFISMLRFVQTDALSEEGWAELKALIEDDDDAADRIRLFYLAVSPSIFGSIIERVSAAGLVSEQSRLVVEKPLGRDLASAKTLNKTLRSVFSESQIFRIDHYLGKETVQNLLALRYSNILFENVWNANAIDHVQITVAETLGVGERGNYYNGSGAMRDMVQNHLLQLLCLVAMEPPARFNADAVRDEKLKVLSALKPIVGDQISQHTIKGQYRDGAVEGEFVPAYIDEIDDETSATETFVALRAEVSNYRWAGVPFYLRTGKRLATRLSEIVIQFKPLSHDIFERPANEVPGNKLVLRLQPNEGVKQYVMIKDPGPGGMRFNEVPLDMSFAQTFDGRNADAYERLIMDVVRGDPTLFMRGDEVEQAWNWIDPIIRHWEETNQPTHTYPAGSSGPPACFELITKDDRSWQPIERVA